MAPTSTTLHRRIYASPLGELTLTTSEQGLRSLTWPEEAGGVRPPTGRRSATSHRTWPPCSTT